MSTILKALQRLEGERREQREQAQELAPPPVEENGAVARAGQPLPSSVGRGRFVPLASAGLAVGLIALFVVRMIGSDSESMETTVAKAPVAEAPAVAAAPPAKDARNQVSPAARTPGKVAGVEGKPAGAPDEPGVRRVALPPERRPRSAVTQRTADTQSARRPSRTIVVRRDEAPDPTKLAPARAPAGPQGDVAATTPSVAAEPPKPTAAKPVAPAPAPAPQLARREPAPAPAPAAKPPPPAAEPAPAPEPKPAAKPAPRRRAPAPSVALVPPPPKIFVERTIWHPTPERRVATVYMQGLKEAVELREGDAVGVLVVSKIEPSGVVFLHGGATLRHKVGGGR